MHRRQRYLVDWDNNNNNTNFNNRSSSNNLIMWIKCNERNSIEIRSSCDLKKMNERIDNETEEDLLYDISMGLPNYNL